jgi:hypothetical protein
LCYWKHLNSPENYTEILETSESLLTKKVLCLLKNFLYSMAVFYHNKKQFSSMLTKINVSNVVSFKSQLAPETASFSTGCNVASNTQTLHTEKLHQEIS